MKIIKIAKGNGKVRVVYSPSRGQRKRLRKLLPLLERAEREVAIRAGVDGVAHGFIRGRSPVTCALQHRGFAATVSCDLSGWFDSVRPEQIAAGLRLSGADPALAERVCFTGVEPSPRFSEKAPRQGLPTSPAAANLAAVEMDRLLANDLKHLPCRWSYTRYADDLTVSVDDPSLIGLVKKSIAWAVMKMGWTLAERKTRVQLASAGRRIVVGVAVDDGIHPTRNVRRRLRAARYQKRVPQARGLEEWSALKLPRARPDEGVKVIRTEKRPNRFQRKKKKPGDSVLIAVRERRLLATAKIEMDDSVGLLEAAAQLQEELARKGVTA